MLILSRKVQERIRIKLPDGRVGWVVLIDVNCNKVRIGLDFPKGVEILREELLLITEYHSNSTTSKEHSDAEDQDQEQADEVKNDADKYWPYNQQ